MKKRMVNVILMTLLAASMVLCGCGNKAQEAPEAMEARAAEPEEKEDEFSEEDLEGVVTGLEDHYIMEKAEDIDYLYNVQYNEDIVVSIQENGAKEVDAAKTGKYTVTYTVTADKEALEDYIEKKSEESEKNEAKESGKNDADSRSDEAGPDEKDDAGKETDRAETEKKPAAEEEGVKDTEAKDEASDKSDADEKNTDQDADAEKEPEDSGDSKEKEDEAAKDVSEDKETVDIEVKKDMTVVDEEKAKDLADKGEVVWTDKNETVSKSDGSEVKEEAEAPASTEDKGTASTPAQKTEKPASGNTGNGSGTKPAQQAHTHNYNIPITTVRHHDAVTQQVWVQDSAAWDEPVYSSRAICSCGADITGNTTGHYVDCNGGYSVKQVQTGTVHHEGTGHYENRVVQNAWDETVTTGYKCSCGAVK